MVGSTAFQSAFMICSAGIRRSKIRTAHRKHRTSAVAAEEMTGIHVGEFFNSPIPIFGTLFYLLLNSGKQPKINYWFMVFFNNDMVAFLKFHIAAVYFLTLIFSLP